MKELTYAKCHIEVDRGRMERRWVRTSPVWRSPLQGAELLAKSV